MAANHHRHRSRHRIPCMPLRLVLLCVSIPVVLHECRSIQATAKQSVSSSEPPLPVASSSTSNENPIPPQASENEDTGIIGTARRTTNIATAAPIQTIGAMAPDPSPSNGSSSKDAGKNSRDGEQNSKQEAPNSYRTFYSKKEPVPLNETTKETIDNHTDVEPSVLSTFTLRVARGQRVTLINPSTPEFSASTKRNRYIKLAVELEQTPMTVFGMSVPTPLDGDAVVDDGISSMHMPSHRMPNTSASSATSRLTSSVLTSNMTSLLQTVSRIDESIRDRVAQQLARDACVAIALRGKGEHQKESWIPSSCHEAFGAQWRQLQGEGVRPRTTVWKGIRTKQPAELFARTSIAARQRQQHVGILDPDDHDGSLLSTVVCGGVWTPRGGRPGLPQADRVRELTSSYSDSIVFEYDPDNLRSIEHEFSQWRDRQIKGQNFDDGPALDSLLYDSEAQIVRYRTLQSQDVESIFPTDLGLGSDRTVVPGQRRHHLQQNTSSSVKIRSLSPLSVGQTSGLRICFCSPPTPAAKVIYPRDVGALHFIPPPILTSVRRQSFHSPVRVFLNPGWDVHVVVQGFNFTSTDNLLSLMLGDCSGFYDAASFRSSHPDRIDTAVSKFLGHASLSPVPVPDDAVFAFSADFKVEESDFSRWHSIYLEYMNRWRIRHSVKSQNATTDNHTISLDPKKGLSMPSTRWDQNSSMAGLFQISNSSSRPPRSAVPVQANVRRRSVTPIVIRDFVVQEEPADLIASFQICFFAHRGQLNGTNLGSVSFYADPKDSTALVGFIIFVILGVPLICGTTLSCYSYRHRKLRKRLRRLRLVRQRDAIERRLLDHLGFDRRLVSSDEDEEPRSSQESDTGHRIHDRKKRQPVRSSRLASPILREDADAHAAEADRNRTYCDAI